MVVDGSDRLRRADRRQWKRLPAGMTPELSGKEGRIRPLEMAMATQTADAGNHRDARISELLRSLIADLTLIARREAELATIEMKARMSEFGGAAAVLAGAGVAGFFALGTLVAAAVLALAIVLPAWAAAVVVGVLLAAIAAVLALVGRARLQAAGPLAPRETIETAQEDIAWIRRGTEQLHANE
jgi:hypothetical protein